MGSYQRPTLKLVFADPEMDGLQVRARRLSVGELLTIYGLADADTQDGTGDEDRARRLDQLLATLAGVLLSWNLHDYDAQPVPLTVDGLRAQDPALIQAVKSALIEASVGVARPLEQPSDGGPPPLEASIPMEAI